MERIFLFTCLCLLYISGGSADLNIYYYNEMYNALNCSSPPISTFGPFTADVTTTTQKNSSRVVIREFSNELLLNNVTGNVRASPSAYKVNLKLNVDNTSWNGTWNINPGNGGNNLWKKATNNKVIKKVWLRSRNYTSNNSDYSIDTCLDVALVYASGNKTNNITAFNLGCWKYDLSIEEVETREANLAELVRLVKLNYCNSAPSSAQFSPILALILVFTALLNNR